MDKKVVLVSGSTGAIGEAVASHLLSRGFVVLGLARGAATIESSHYHHFRADIRNERAVLDVLGKAQGQFRLYGLVQCAAVASMNHLITTPHNSFRDMFDVNVAGAFLLCREAVKWMQGEKRGRIVNFSSAALALSLEGEAGYLASKAALETMTRVYAREAAPFGVTVNCVAPSVCSTGLVSGVPKVKLEALLKRQAIPRYCEPADLVNAVDFFLDEKSDLVTGQVLALGGLF